MPLVKTISGSELTIGLWSLSEDKAQLAEGLNLSEEETLYFDSCRNEKRQREFLAVRQVLSVLTGGAGRLSYYADGKPHLFNLPGYVSISHSRNMVAVMLASQQAGIDVEDINRNTEKIDTRFLSGRELEWTRDAAGCRLTRLLCWCAKEAVFKMSDENLADFSRYIEILPFDAFIDSSMEARIKLQHGIYSVRIDFCKVSDNVLAWCTTKSVGMKD